MKFSDIEKQELLKAWIAISFAFAVFHNSITANDFFLTFTISAFTVGIAFLLHEIAHKYVAQRYRCLAEFRADNTMLGIMVILAFFSPVLFAAPGAVYISGHITKAKNGKISMAGPLTNIILSVLFFIALIFLLAEGIIAEALFYGFQINAMIALFNMIPVMNFDGEKILRWNKLIYFCMVLVSAILVFIPSLPA